MREEKSEESRLKRDEGKGKEMKMAREEKRREKKDRIDF